MARLVVLFTHPDDVEQFERGLADEYLPAARAMPGLVAVEVLRVTGTPLGHAPYFAMAELRFESGQSLEAALESDAGLRAQRALGFAPGLATSMIAEEVRGGG